MATLFSTKVDYATDARPFSVAVVDVNGDGKPDIVTANINADTASVLLNQGSGIFGTKIDYTTGTEPRSVSVVDVNGDGKPDIVTANSNYNANTVSILLNKGSGTFASRVDYATGNSPYSVSVVDVNGDGKPDIVTANYGSSEYGNTASVLINQGAGTFYTNVNYEASAYSEAVSVVDVNGDGKPDIVTVGSQYSCSMSATSVLLNQLGGAFGTKVNYTTGSCPRSVSVVDVNGDSKPDIVTANSNYNANTVSVLLNKGSGTFASRVDYATGNSPHSVSVVDVNADGKPDIVTANYVASTASILLNQGRGTFAAKVDYATSSSPNSVAVVDVNADGKPDIVTANYDASTVSVLINTTPLCAAGNYLDANPGSSCTPCPAGYYNSGVGYGESYIVATACTVSPAGSYVDGAGFTKPIPCPAGTYSTAIGATSFDTCLAAPAGSFTNTKLGATNYTQCPAGYYNSGVGYGSSYTDINACKQCTAGFVTSLNSTVCAPCSNTIQVNSAGLYNGTNCNDIFEITTSSNVTIDLCSGGSDTIIAHSTTNSNQQITLRCFNTSDDKLQFSGAQCIADKDFNFTDC